MVIFATLFQRCRTLWKLTLKMTTLFRRCLTLFNSMLKYTTLLNLVNYNFDVHNVVSTLIWHCAMSRRHINLKTTLSWCWSVCWVHFSIKKGRAPVSMHCLTSFLEIWKLNNHKFSAWDCWCCSGHEIYFNLCFELF